MYALHIPIFKFTYQLIVLTGKHTHFRKVRHLGYGAWAYRKEKIRGAETNLPDFPDFARQVPKNFSGENLFIRPPPSRQKNFGQCTILGVQKFFGHTKIFRNIILIFPML
jgi:hypothetical protein